VFSSIRCGTSPARCVGLAATALITKTLPMLFKLLTQEKAVIDVKSDARAFHGKTRSLEMSVRAGAVWV
jgi:hypothetical protein